MTAPESTEKAPLTAAPMTLLMPKIKMPIIRWALALQSALQKSQNVLRHDVFGFQPRQLCKQTVNGCRHLSCQQFDAGNQFGNHQFDNENRKTARERNAASIQAGRQLLARAELVDRGE